MNSYQIIASPQLLLVHSQMKAARLPCKLCKNKENEQLPENCLATPVISALTAALRMFCFFFAIEYIIPKSNMMLHFKIIC